MRYSTLDKPCKEHKVALQANAPELRGMLRRGAEFYICEVCGWICLEVSKLPKKKKAKKKSKKVTKKVTKKVVKKTNKKKR